MKVEMESNLANAYKEAYKLACEKLVSLDPGEISLNTGTVYSSGSQLLTVRYLNKDYQVQCSTGEVTGADGSEVTTTLKVLILHYLINAKVKPLTGNLISFKELRGGGAIYYQTFQKRAIFPLLKTFEKNPDSLIRAGQVLGGSKESYGNASVTIRVFPLVPVTYVLWQGDEEIPSSATILFDEAVESYLPGEDIVLAASFGTYELMKYAK